MTPANGCAEEQVYEIQVEGTLDDGWSEWLGGLDVRPMASGVTVLTGPIRDQTALHSPETERIIAEFRARSGCVDREVTDEEIIARTLYAMVNEGAHILEGGFAQRGSR